MSLKHLMGILDLVDRPDASGELVADYLRELGGRDVSTRTVNGERGATDMIKIVIPGIHGKSADGDAPTIGLIGRLGGLGARPEKIGLVSDGDGAVTVLTAAAKLLDMASHGDRLDGDVILATHIDPDAPTLPHDPVPFMNSSIEMAVNNEYEVDDRMDAVLTIDTTRGNRICNHRGFAITPTIKAGWIVRVSEDLLSVVERTTGDLPVTIPITMQDITPYSNGLYHMNSIVQPCTATDAPVVGVAITAHSAVPGSATGACDPMVVEQTVRFIIESAKDYGRGELSFYDEGEFQELVSRYGRMTVLQTNGKEK